MNKSKFGYACINMILSEQDISTNRTMIKKTFDTKGLSYVSELIIKNLQDLYKILEWNEKNEIRNYRMSSEMMPWFSHYDIEALPNIDAIKTILQNIGDFAKKHNHKLSYHPGPFNCLASPNESVVEKTIYELEQHSKVMDLMGLEATPFYNVNIHIGGVYGDKQSAMDRFIINFNRLSNNAKSRLTIENDDSPNGYTVKDLYYVYEHINTPIVFDTLHWFCNPGNLTYEESFNLAHSTWGSITPEIHHSSSKKLWEDDSKTIKTHADFIYDEVNTCGKDVYVSFESKMKETALLKYKTEFLK